MTGPVTNESEKEMNNYWLASKNLRIKEDLKSAQLMTDYDIHIRYLRHSEEETQEMIARLKIQKLEELKLQILAQNQTSTVISVQQSQNNQEIGKRINDAKNYIVDKVDAYLKHLEKEYKTLNVREIVQYKTGKQIVEEALGQ